MINSKEVLEIKDYIIGARRFFHENPEPSLKEYKTADFVEKELTGMGLRPIRVGETGLLAEIDTKNPGPTAFLRADMDALELEDKKTCPYSSKNKGLAHACGHDGHTAALLGAAKIIAANKSKYKGKIKLAFQAAEEIGAGARIFVRDGHLKDVDFAFGIHLASDILLGKCEILDGPSYASCDIFKVQVYGEAAHAASPHLGKDAALCLANILTELQNLVSRKKDPQEACVISVGKISAGTRYNVVADSGFLEGTLRCLDEDLRKDFLKRIENLARLIGEIHDCKITFTNYDAASVLVNDKDMADLARTKASEIFSFENIISNGKPSLGAEDFADYSQVVKSVFVRVGSQSGKTTAYPHHHQLFDIDERALLAACDLHLNMVK